MGEGRSEMFQDKNDAGGNYTMYIIVHAVHMQFTCSSHAVHMQFNIMQKLFWSVRNVHDHACRR